MNPTRRTAMRLLASTTLISMPAAVATAAPQALDTDAALSVLYAEWQRLDEAYIAAIEAKEPAEAQYEALEPAHPSTLQVKPFDAFDVDHGFNELPNGKRVLVYYPGSVEQLRALPAPTRAVSDGPDEEWVHVPDARRAARRHEIIAAYDDWTVEKRVLADRLGLTAARAYVQALCDAQIAVEQRIRETPPAGLPGLIIKARLAREIDDSRLLDQIVADLLAMQMEAV